MQRSSWSFRVVNDSQHILRVYLTAPPGQQWGEEVSVAPHNSMVYGIPYGGYAPVTITNMDGQFVCKDWLVEAGHVVHVKDA